MLINQWINFYLIFETKNRFFTKPSYPLKYPRLIKILQIKKLLFITMKIELLKYDKTPRNLI